MHKGIDIRNSKGTPIYATASGIARSNISDSFGKVVMINHQNGYETVYAHLSKIVKREGVVSRGELVGYMGNTGLSLGTHLHYEIRKYRKSVNPIEYMLPTTHIID